MNDWSPFEWITAIRFLREGRMQTLFIIVGVSIGVAVIVFMSAMLSGLQANFIKRVLTSQAHIQLIPPQEVARALRSQPGVIELATIQSPVQRLRSIDQWQKIRQQLQSWPDITHVSPSVSAPALAVRGDASRSVSLTGIDPAAYFSIVRIPDYIVAGQPRVTGDDILIGTELAKDLGVVVGDKLNVVAGNGASRVLTVTGIFDLGNKGANERSTFVALRTAQAMANLVGGVTSIDLTVRDVYQAETVAQAVQASTGIEADSWIRTNAQFFTAVNAQKSSNTMIRVFVALSVAFGIASVLVVSVIQRAKDIGILRAMGTSRGQILRLFLLQGALVGIAGAVIGSGLGAGALILWHRILRQADGSELFPLMLEPGLFAYTIALASLTGIAAASIPWWRSVAEAADVLRLEAVKKSYNVGTPGEVEVLHGIDLGLGHHEFVALIGPSGSGKSTLLNIIGLLDRPTSGRLFIGGQETSRLDDKALTHIRGHSIGFVFQYHYLISAFTALENVMMPLLADNEFPNEKMRARAASLLEQVGLSQWRNNRATNMSGGQQQRVAIARALAMNPALVLADEPTGNLDTQSANTVFEMMRTVNRDLGTAFLLVTHNMDLARRCDRIIELVDGRVVRPQTAAPTP